MRKMMMAFAAASMAVPAATIALPQSAEAHQPRYYSGKTWYDNRGRLRCKRPNGTTGLIIGAAGGALVGRAIDTRGERATGTIIGAATGALLGRHIDRNRKVRCR